jgi:hypothetical protein
LLSAANLALIFDRYRFSTLLCAALLTTGLRFLFGFTNLGSSSEIGLVLLLLLLRLELLVKEGDNEPMSGLDRELCIA